MKRRSAGRLIVAFALFAPMACAPSRGYRDPFDSAATRAGARAPQGDRGGDRTREAPDPFAKDTRPAVDEPTAPRATDPLLAESKPKIEAAPAIGAAGPAIANVSDRQPATDYRAIRSRLDKAGARDIRLESDDATGEKVFSCEVPNPNGANTARVFKAKDADELKAMLAVTEAVEKFVAAGP